MDCPACQRHIASDSRFCSYCGKSLRKCEVCQRFFGSEAAYCGSCGKRLAEPRTPTFDPPDEPDESIFGYLYALTATPTQFALYLGDNTIGAGGNNDIIVQSPAVSWNHAILICRNDKILLQDSASTNGTYLNGRRIRTPVHLNHGDTLRFGGEEFRVWLKAHFRTSHD